MDYYFLLELITEYHANTTDLIAYEVLGSIQDSLDAGHITKEQYNELILRVE